MQPFQRSSLGYLSGLVLVGACSALMGCSSDGGSAAGASAASNDDAGTAGTKATSGGASAGGSGGSSAQAGTSGSSGTGGSPSGGTSSGGSSGGGKAGSSSSGGSAGSSSTSNAGATSRETNDGDYSVDDFGYDEPDGPEHPLTQVETKILRREEVSLLAPAASGSFGTTLDDAGHDYQTIAGASAASYLDGLTVFETTSGNLDDDGNDELVAAGLVGTAAVIRVVDSDADGLFTSMKELKLDDTSYEHVRVRLADIDQDGRDEILVLAVTADNHVVARTYEDATESFAFIDEVYRGPGEEIAAAFGNFDADRSPELAFLIDTGNDLVLEVRDDASTGHALLKQLTNADTGLIRGQGLVVGGLRIEAGNFDADPADELVAFAEGYDTDTENGSSGLYMRGYDDAAAGFAQLANTQRDLPRPHPDASYRYTQNWGWQTLVADSNGDGQDEAFVLVRRPGDDGNGDEIKLFRETFGAEVAKWTAGEQVLEVAIDVGNPNTMSMASATGRDDGFGADVIVAVRQGTTLSPYRVRAGTTNEKWISASTPLPTSSVSSATGPVWATSGDWDADSLRLRYTGQKWLELGRPQPIIVVAAPPVKEGISQNYENSGSAYGTAVTKTQEATQEQSFTEKVTMSFEVNLPVLDFLSAGAHAELSRQFTDTHTTTETVSTSISYESAYPDDIIVFRGTLFTRYEYEIVGGGDEDPIGTKMTIDVPLDHSVYKWTVPFYNAALGDQGSPIDEKILKHTVGDPASYPSVTERNALHPLWQADEATPVHQGSAQTPTSIDLTTEQTSGTSFTTSSEFGGEVGMFVSAGYSQGWDSTTAYSVTTGKETHFVGTVGDIKDGDDYTTWKYKYGLFVYDTHLAGGEAVKVMTYWTELLGDGFKK